jgi:hypothetical protein
VIRRTAWVCVAALTLAVAGCGGESLDDVLRGLKSAAESKATYDAIAHADDLEKREKAVVNAFCTVTNNLSENEESPTEEAYFEQIQAEAERELGEPISEPLTSALDKLRATYDLAQINGRAAQLYVKACFR